jgi:hypothetical protein
MNFGNYLALAGTLLLGVCALYQAGVVIRRRKTGPRFPADWSPQQVAAWARWRRVFGCVVAAAWIWGGAAFLLGLILGPPGVPLPAWLMPLSTTLLLTTLWLSMVVPAYDPARPAPPRLKLMRVMIVTLAIIAFLVPVAVIGDAYSAPPWGSNVSAPTR